MINNWMACGLLVIGAFVADSAIAEPKDKSLATWKKVQEEANAKVEKELKKQFALELQRVEDLENKVFKVGDEVEVTIVKGRVRRISGTFGGIKEKGKLKYVDIGGTQYLLSDIDANNRPLLLFGAYPDQREPFLKQERQRLEADMARVRKQKQMQEYARRGYDAAFFNNSLLIGDRFYTGSDLGADKLRLRLEINLDSKIPYAVVRILNPINNNPETRLPTIATVALNDLEIATTTTEAKNPKDQNWTSYNFFVAKRDLGANPIQTVANRMSINFAGLGELKATWQFKLKQSKRAVVARRKGNTLRLVEYSAYLGPNSLGKTDTLGLLQVKTAILRGRRYQRDAAFEMKKLNIELPDTGIANDKAAKAKEPKSE